MRPPRRRDVPARTAVTTPQAPLQSSLDQLGPVTPSSPDPLGLAAVDTLGIIGSFIAVSNLFFYLFFYLGSLDDETSSPLSEAIGRVSNLESLPLITSMVYGQTAGSTLSTRVAAVQALSNYEPTEVCPILNWLEQNDQNSRIREAAKTALKRMDGQ